MSKVVEWIKKHSPRPVIKFTDPTGRKGIFIGIKWEF